MKIMKIMSPLSVCITVVLILTPLHVTWAALVLRLDASNLPLGTLSSWLDASGNTNNVSQGDNNYKPAVVNMGSVFNGRNVVQFDGSNDYLTSATASYTAKTVVAVFRVDSTLRNSSQLGQVWGQYNRGHVATDPRDGITGGGGWSFDGSVGAQVYFGLDGASLQGPVGEPTSQPWSDDTVHLVTAQFTSDLAIDQHSVGSLAPIYSGHYYGGQIAEVLVFDTTLSSDEKTGLEYLMAKRWGVTGPSIASQSQIDAANALFPEGFYVPTRLVLRLQARDLPLGPLASWLDTSGNTNSVAQSDSSRQPTVVRLGSDFKGRKVVQFDGSNDYLDNDAVSYTAKTVIVVFRVDSNLRNLGHLGQIWGQYEIAHVATDFRYLDGYSFCWSFDGGTAHRANFGLDGADLSTSSYEDTDTQVWSDDTVHMVNVQYTTSIAMDTHTIGACLPTHGLYYGGQVAEILVFNTILSSEEKTGLEYLMAERWGVAGPSTATQAQIDFANALFPDGVYFEPKGLLLMFN